MGRAAAACWLSRCVLDGVLLSGESPPSELPVAGTAEPPSWLPTHPACPVHRLPRRFKSLQKRALIEPRRKIEQKKQAKKIEYVQVGYLLLAGSWRLLLAAC